MVRSTSFYCGPRLDSVGGGSAALKYKRSWKLPFQWQPASVKLRNAATFDGTYVLPVAENLYFNA
jgi:hypothetical protein